MGGLILDKTVSDPNFAGMAVFTPVINGETLASAAGGTKRLLCHSGLQQARESSSERTRPNKDRDGVTGPTGDREKPRNQQHESL